MDHSYEHMVNRGKEKLGMTLIGKKQGVPSHFVT